MIKIPSRSPFGAELRNLILTLRLKTSRGRHARGAKNGRILPGLESLEIGSVERDAGASARTIQKQAASAFTSANELKFKLRKWSCAQERSCSPKTRPFGSGRR
jgi:hypothetical protein